MQQAQPNKLIIPRFYRPWPHQQQAWRRRLSGKYHYYFKLWSRQAGKDTDDIQYELKRAWDNPGTQGVYVGIDNGWVKENIFKKYIEGRTHWMDYPDDKMEVKDTDRRVIMLNNPEDKAPATIKFIGFLNDQALIGSSYDAFTVSELSLYPREAFKFVEPIWNSKIGRGLPLSVSFNSTPRGMNNLLFDMLRKYTKQDEPDLFEGEHGDVYVDIQRIGDLKGMDGESLYEPEYIEELKGRYQREFGNLNMFNQEYMVDFLTVNAGLVYQGLEQLVKEGRYMDFNLDTTKPVYMAWDISSKDKMTDWTSCIVYQWIYGKLFLYDYFEDRGKAFVDCVSQLQERGYFRYIKVGVLPWDSERSASSETPIEEARRIWPDIMWHSLSKERVDRGIAEVRRLLPNTVIRKNYNENGIDWLMECLGNYEYKRLEAMDDWAATPKHNRYSHICDSVRYAVMGIKEIAYLNLPEDGRQVKVPRYYEAGEDAPEQPSGLSWQQPSPLAKQRKREEEELYYQ
jgi:hypothetical protein